MLFYGFLGSLAAGLMTSVGAAPVLFGRTISPAMNDAMLGFAAGVMLAASFFSLLIPSIDASEALYGSPAIAAGIAALSVFFGVLTIAALNQILPHEHIYQGREGPIGARLRRVWLFVIAITLHNIPEGLAVGVAFGGGDIGNGVSLAIGTGLQNAPEGLAVALAMMTLGKPPSTSFLVASLTGLVEPVAGAAGALAIVLSTHMLPWALAFAAGAMLFVISHEIIPETHRHGRQWLATGSLTLGLCLMMFLDVALG